MTGDRPPHETVSPESEAVQTNSPETVPDESGVPTSAAPAPETGSEQATPAETPVVQEQQAAKPETSEPAVAEHVAPDEPTTSPTAETASSPAEPASETVAEAPEPVVAEQITPEIPATTPSGETGDSPTKPATEAVTDDSEPGRRRVTLNPTVVGDAKAVPSLKADPLPEAGSGADGDDEDEESRPKPVPVSRPPVEIPAADSLDDELEAQISAAMAGDEAAATASAAEPDAVETGLAEESFHRGQRIRGTVGSVTTDYVFFDIGGRSPGMLPKRQFPADKVPSPGEVFEIVVDHVDAEEGVIAVNLPRGIRKPRGNWDELEVGQVVECLVTKTNKGGLEVAVGTIRAFLPASQIGIGFVGDTEQFIGQKLQVTVTEVNPQKRNLIVSRKHILQQERKEAAKSFWEEVETGKKYEGTVKTIKDYGVFVDLGGVDGFMHVGEISWGRIKHPSDLLKEGDKIEVVVLTIDKEKKKIGLGMRQLVRNPWEEAVEKFPPGSNVSGRVTRTAEFGAFVEISPGVEGLVHISELDHRRVRSVADVLREGQQAELQVLEVDADRQRISLSLKALKDKPELPAKEAEPETPAYERKRKGPLRGGRDDAPSSSGGLFGDPNKF